MNKSIVLSKKIIETFYSIAEKHHMKMHECDFSILKYDSITYSCYGNIDFTLDNDRNENNITISISGNNNCITKKDIIKFSDLVSIKSNTKCISAIDFDVYYTFISKYKIFIDELKGIINKISIKTA